MGRNKDDKRTGAGQDDEILDDAEDFVEDETDADSGDQDWESYDSDDGDGEDLERAVAPRKKGLFSFNTIVIVCAVVFGGAFIAMQLSKKAPQQQAQPRAQQAASSVGLPMIGEKERAEFTKIEETPVAPPGLPSDPGTGSSGAARQGAGLPPLPEANEMLPMPGVGEGESIGLSEVPPPVAQAAKPSPEAGKLPVAPDVLTPMPGQGATDVLDLPSETQTKSSGKPDDASPMPKVADVFKADEKKPEMPAAPIKDVDSDDLSDAALPVPLSDEGKDMPGKEEVLAPQPVVAPSADVTALQTELSGLGSRLDRLEKTLESLASAPSGDTAKNGEVEALRETVRKLESKISSLSSVEKKVEAAPKAAAREGEPAEKPIRKLRKSAAPKDRTTSRSAPPAAESAPSLEVRSAQPGQAWVARPGDNDLQSVSVGDTLPGIGRVTSISPVGGRWVVEGTKGRLSQ